MELTSSASISGPSPGERLSVNGIPSTTNCVWYSDPRGCSTAFPSYNHPGCELTKSCTDRPGNDVIRCPIVPDPNWFSDPAWWGSIKVDISVTVTEVLTEGRLSLIVVTNGAAERISIDCETGAKSGCRTSR